MNNENNNHCVYLVFCENGFSIETGITSQVENRFWRHQFHKEILLKDLTESQAKIIQTGLIFLSKKDGLFDLYSVSDSD
jgi:hypothetical protein